MYMPPQPPSGHSYYMQPTMPIYYTAPQPPVPQPSKPARRIWRWLVPLIGLVTAGAVAPFVLTGSGPSLEDAQRECRTAMNAEMTERATSANASTDYAVGSITGIELQENQETDDGFVIYGEAQVEITAGFGQSTHSSVLLACTAHIGDDGDLHTSVSNR